MKPLTDSALQFADAVTKSTASMSAPQAERMAQGWSKLTVATGDQIRCYWDLHSRLAAGEFSQDASAAQAEFYERTINNHIKATAALTSLLFPFATVTDIEALGPASDFRPGDKQAKHTNDKIELVTADRQLSHVAQSSKSEVVPDRERTKAAPQATTDAQVAA